MTGLNPLSGTDLSDKHIVANPTEVASKLH